MHKTSAQGWCTGMSQRDGIGREVREGFRMGKYVNLWLIHVNGWQNLLQYCKVISLQLIKINGGKKKKPQHSKKLKKKKRAGKLTNNFLMTFSKYRSLQHICGLQN